MTESLPSDSSRSGGPKAIPMCSRTMDYGLCTYTGAQEPVQREALKKMRVQRDQLLSNGLGWGQSFSCWQYLANTSSLQNHAIHAKAEPIIYIYTIVVPQQVKKETLSEIISMRKISTSINQQGFTDMLSMPMLVSIL